MRGAFGWLPWLLTAGIVMGALVLALSMGAIAYAIRLEEHDDFCASCHTQPEVEYYQRSLQVATDLASYHRPENTHCIDCHSGAGPVGRAVGLSQGVDDLVAWYMRNYAQPARTTRPVSDGACLKCHAQVTQRALDRLDTQVLGMGPPGHFHYLLADWRRSDPQASPCVACHPAHQMEGVGLKFISFQQARAVCEACHRAMGENKKEGNH